MESKVEELKKDIAELRGLESQAQRQKIKDILSLEVRKLSSELIKLQQEFNKKDAAACVPSQQPSNRRYQVKVNNYAWDQTSKFVKFYVTIQKAHSIPQERVICQFSPKSLELVVQDIDNKDYVFTIKNLLKEISPERSTWKIKTDMVIINAAKIEEVSWSHVTELEKKAKDGQNEKFKPSNSGDPNEGIMSLMKNMYDQGDDEMKRTIAKAWTESQNKSTLP